MGQISKNNQNMDQYGLINIPLSIWDFILRFVGISLSSREFMTRLVGKVFFDFIMKLVGPSTVN
jgi:hypothetical protein